MGTQTRYWFAVPCPALIGRVLKHRMAHSPSVTTIGLKRCLDCNIEEGATPYFIDGSHPIRNWPEHAFLTSSGGLFQVGSNGGGHFHQIQPLNANQFNNWITTPTAVGQQHQHWHQMNHQQTFGTNPHGGSASP